MAEPSERFRAVYDAHFDAVHRYCLRRLPVDEAADAVCDVFVVAWRRLRAVPDGDAELRWLYGVARNVVRNHQRSLNRARRLVQRVGVFRQEHDDPATTVVQSAENREAMEALALLSARDREVLLLRAYEGLSTPEIAAVVGCSLEAAKKRVARATKRLSRMLAEFPVAERTRAEPRRGER